MYGTGTNYDTCYAFAGNTSALRVTANSTGTGTNMADGATGTGFTFNNIHAGSTTTSTTAYNTVANTVWVVGGQSPTDAGGGQATGMTFTVLNFATGLIAQQKQSFTILTVAASSLTHAGNPAKYFTFTNGTTTYYVWFKFTNETDPAPGGTGIEINLGALTTATQQDVANVIREAINQYQSDYLIVGALPSASSYFSFWNQGSSAKYNVWFQLNGAGSPPTTPTGANIMVALTGGETNPQCVTKILTAINAYQYAVPDFRGMFLRGNDPNATWDLDAANRWSTISGLSGANVGTFEYGQFLSHTHVATATTLHGNGAGNGAIGEALTGGSFPPNVVTVSNANTGGSETRPVNASVNFFIHY